jgi:hypothetical protein
MNDAKNTRTEPLCPKRSNGQHWWVPYVERLPKYHRGLECRDCGYRPDRNPHEANERH